MRWTASIFLTFLFGTLAPPDFNTWHPILGMTWIKGNVAIFTQRNDDWNRAKPSECIAKSRPLRIGEERRLHVAALKANARRFAANVRPIKCA